MTSASAFAADETYESAELEFQSLRPSGRVSKPVVSRQFAMCNTPGCTFRDFHDGAHSFECIVERKRKREIRESPTIILDACGIGSYGGMCKVGQREMFVHAAKEIDAPVMYTDGPNAALTILLLEKGLTTDRLVPVNNRTSVARQIQHMCPGVKCKVGDICNIANNADTNEFGVVWFDLCGVDFGQFDVSDLVHCAATKFFTLSSRQLLCVDVQTALCRKLVANHERIIEQTLYTGLSGKAMNMVFVVSRGTGNARRHSSDDLTHKQGVSIGTVVKIPLSYWRDQSFLERYNYKVFGNVGEQSLIGAVHARVPTSNSEYRLTFQCTDGTTKLCGNKYRDSFILSSAI